MVAAASADYERLFLTVCACMHICLRTVVINLRLREWRERRGLSLRELAQRAGVSFTTCHRIEVQKISPTVTVLERLANALDIRIVDFFPIEAKGTRRTKR